MKDLNITPGTCIVKDCSVWNSEKGNIVTFRAKSWAEVYSASDMISTGEAKALSS